MAWSLDNAEQRAAEAPQTFFIPAAELRNSLQPGDEVKLIFRLQRDDGEVAVERMWVEVTQTQPYIGRLRNVPQLDGVIDIGAAVPFGAEHVCGYAYPPEALGYDPDQRCFLLRRVAETDGPPPLLLCNEDGDWEAHAPNETDEELADDTRVLLWTLGYLTDRFPQTAAALRDAPSPRRGILRRRRRSTWWEWNGSRYVRIDR